MWCDFFAQHIYILLSEELFSEPSQQQPTYLKTNKRTTKKPQESCHKVRRLPFDEKNYILHYLSPPLMILLIYMKKQAIQDFQGRREVNLEGPVSFSSHGLCHLLCDIFVLKWHYIFSNFFNCPNKKTLAIPIQNFLSQVWQDFRPPLICVCLCVKFHSAYLYIV